MQYPQFMCISVCSLLVLMCTLQMQNHLHDLNTCNGCDNIRRLQILRVVIKTQHGNC